MSSIQTNTQVNDKSPLNESERTHFKVPMETPATNGPTSKINQQFSQILTSAESQVPTQANQGPAQLHGNTLGHDLNSNSTQTIQRETTQSKEAEMALQNARQRVLSNLQSEGKEGANSMILDGLNQLKTALKQQNIRIDQQKAGFAQDDENGPNDLSCQKDNENEHTDYQALDKAQQALTKILNQQKDQRFLALDLLMPQSLNQSQNMILQQNVVKNEVQGMDQILKNQNGKIMSDLSQSLRKLKYSSSSNFSFNRQNNQSMSLANQSNYVATDMDGNPSCNQKTKTIKEVMSPGTLPQRSKAQDLNGLNQCKKDTTKAEFQMPQSEDNLLPTHQPDVNTANNMKSGQDTPTNNPKISGHQTINGVTGSKDTNDQQLSTGFVKITQQDNSATFHPHIQVPVFDYGNYYKQGNQSSNGQNTQGQINNFQSKNSTGKDEGKEQVEGGANRRCAQLENDQLQDSQFQQSSMSVRQHMLKNTFSAQDPLALQNLQQANKMHKRSSNDKPSSPETSHNQGDLVKTGGLASDDQKKKVYKETRQDVSGNEYERSMHDKLEGLLKQGQKKNFTYPELIKSLIENHQQDVNIHSYTTQATLPSKTVPQNSSRPQVEKASGDQQKVPSSNFKQLVEQDQQQVLENHYQSLKVLGSSNLYRYNPQLQKWLEQNWLVGSMCIKMIVQNQIDHLEKLGLTTKEPEKTVQAQQNHSNYNKHVDEVIRPREAPQVQEQENESFSGILSELNKIQEENQGKLLNLLKQLSDNQEKNMQTLQPQKSDELKIDENARSKLSSLPSNASLRPTNYNELDMYNNSDQMNLQIQENNQQEGNKTKSMNQHKSSHSGQHNEIEGLFKMVFEKFIDKFYEKGDNASPKGSVQEAKQEQQKPVETPQLPKQEMCSPANAQGNQVLIYELIRYLSQIAQMDSSLITQLIQNCKLQQLQNLSPTDENNLSILLQILSKVQQQVNNQPQSEPGSSNQIEVDSKRNLMSNGSAEGTFLKDCYVNQLPQMVQMKQKNFDISKQHSMSRPAPEQLSHNQPLGPPEFRQTEAKMSDPLKRDHFQSLNQFGNGPFYQSISGHRYPLTTLGKRNHNSIVHNSLVAAAAQTMTPQPNNNKKVVLNKSHFEEVARDLSTNLIDKVKLAAGNEKIKDEEGDEYDDGDEETQNEGKSAADLKLQLSQLNEIVGNDIEADCDDYVDDLESDNTKYHNKFNPNERLQQVTDDLQIPRIQLGGRRKNKNLPYEVKIMNALREVLSEADLLDTRAKIFRGLKKYQKDLSKVIVEANRPKKNHNNAKNNFRGSKFRGPSKNRNKWQVMKMINKETIRIGAIKTELEAARIYDFLAILTEGLNAKTNFNYNVHQLQIIMSYFFQTKSEPIRQSQFPIMQHQTDHRQFVYGENIKQANLNKVLRTEYQTSHDVSSIAESMRKSSFPEQFRNNLKFAQQLTRKPSISSHHQYMDPSPQNMYNPNGMNRNPSANEAVDFNKQIQGRLAQQQQVKFDQLRQYDFVNQHQYIKNGDASNPEINYNNDPSNSMSEKARLMKILQFDKIDCNTQQNNNRGQGGKQIMKFLHIQ